MKIKSIAGYFALWCAFLAAGTWILPDGSSLVSLARAAPMRDGEEGESEDLIAAAGIARTVSEWIESGEFQLSTWCDSSVDLDGDGVSDTIVAGAVDLLGGGGSVALIDGASGETRFWLEAPSGEYGFGSRVCAVADADRDGVRELVVASGLLVAGTPEVRYRLVSGATGKLIAIRHGTVVTNEIGGGSPEMAELRAGDADGDGEVGVQDVSLALTELGASPLSRPAVDFDCDGYVNPVDVVGIIEATGNAASAVAVTEFELLASQPDFQPVGGEPVAGLSWLCWARVAGLAITLVILIGEIGACTALCTPPNPVCIAAYNACMFLIVCTIANFVLKLARFFAECYGSQALSTPLQVFFEVGESLTQLCAQGAAAVGFLKVMQKAIDILRGVRL